MTGLRHGQTPTGGWVRLAGDLDLVAPAVDVLHGYLTQHPQGTCSFAFDLLCFEMLSNAVRHGCAGDPTRQVLATLEVTPDQIALCVADDGPGFDWRAWAATLPDARQTQGRGRWILHRYSDAVTFNEASNQVTVIHHVKPPAAQQTKGEAHHE